MKVLVIIPCYNESENILAVVQRLTTLCPQVDYLVVNDCSSDNTLSILREHGIHHLNLPLNLGIGGGVQSGYLYAMEHDYDITVQMDGDGQHDPHFLQQVIAPVAEGKLDMCIGSRFIEKKGFQTSFMRRVGIRFLSGLIHLLTGERILDVTSGYRACNRQMTAYFARDYAQDYPEPEAIITALCNGFAVGEVAVEMEERQGGGSSIRAFKSISYMAKVSLALVIHRLGARGKGKRT